MAWFLFATFYAAMAAAGYIIELVFTPLGLGHSGASHANVGGNGIRWTYSSILNIVFLLLALGLLWRFHRTGGRAMLTMMGVAPDDPTGRSGTDLAKGAPNVITDGIVSQS